MQIEKKNLKKVSEMNNAFIMGEKQQPKLFFFFPEFLAKNTSTH